MRPHIRSAINRDSHPSPAAPNLPLNFLYPDRCSKTAFIQVFFFVWCTFIAQVVLTIRYGVIPSITCVGFHLIPASFFVGPKIVWYNVGEQKSCGSLRVCHAPSVSVRCTSGSFGNSRPRFGLRPFCCLRWSLILPFFYRREYSATTPSHKALGLPAVCLHQTPEGGNCLHSNIVVLW